MCVGWALITGASGDIGEAISSQLAEKGYHLYLHFNKNQRKLEQLQDKLRQRFPKQEFISVQADLRQTQQVDVLISQLQSDIDVLIHNSGQSHMGLITDVDDTLASEFINLHLTSPFLLTKRLLPSMIRKKCGKIIFITSIWGITGASTEVMYSMVKGGQNSFVKALAKEVAPSGLSVNAVAPGAIDTQMLSNFSQSDIDLLKDEIPMGRLGTTQEVASLVRYLITEQAAYINGQIISINGAWHC